MLNLQNRNEFYYYFLPTQTRIEPYLLEQEKIDVNMRDSNNGSALLYAIYHGLENVFELLLKKNADIKRDGGMALILAKYMEQESINEDERSQYQKIINTLTQKNVEINQDDVINLLQLCYTSYLNVQYADLATMILRQYKVNPDIIIDKDKNTTLLMFAAECDRIDLFNLLIEMKANFEIKDSNNETALILAVKNNNYNIVETILKNKVGDVNTEQIKTSYGSETLLMYAIRQGYADMVRLIIPYCDANTLNSVNSDRCTPLMMAIKNKDTHLIDLLISKKEVVSGIGNKFSDALASAIDNKVDIEIIKKLVACVDDPNMTIDNTGTTLLMLAAKTKNNQLVKILIDKGADLDKTNNFGESAIMYFIQNIDCDTIEQQLANGKKIEDKLLYLACILSDDMKKIIIDNKYISMEKLERDTASINFLLNYAINKDSAKMITRLFDVAKINLDDISSETKSLLFNLSKKDGNNLIVKTLLIIATKLTPPNIGFIKSLIDHGASRQTKIGEQSLFQWVSAQPKNDDIKALEKLLQPTSTPPPVISLRKKKK